MLFKTLVKEVKAEWKPHQVLNHEDSMSVILLVILIEMIKAMSSRVKTRTASIEISKVDKRMSVVILLMERPAV